MKIEYPLSSRVDKYPAKAHAARVASALGAKKGLIYLPGAPTRYLEDSDQPRGFRQRRYFYYLSGVDEADCHVTYDIDSKSLTLWLPPINPSRVVWVGRGSTCEEAMEKYDIDQACYTTTLPAYLQAWPRGDNGYFFVIHPEQAPRKIQESSCLNYKDLIPAMDGCRVIKDSYEIRMIKRANAISRKAHEGVLRKLLSFKNEAQVDAHFLEVCIAHGSKTQAYEIIAGSGENAAVLHYVKNDEAFGDRQLMCLDAGAEWDCYASDVTRTFPLSGHWPSQEAKDIYDLVQEMQTRCMNTLKPGKQFVNAHFLAHQVVIEGLLKLGILHNGSVADIFEAGTSLAFFPHGLGHHLGLEVHDVSPVTSSTLDDFTGYRWQIEEHGQPPQLIPTHHFVASSDLRAPCTQAAPGLAPGMVITVEPGVYFNRFALERLFLSNPKHAKYIDQDVLKRYMPVGGVRIEDDILITTTGWTNLTTTAKGEAALRIIRGET